MKKKKYAERVKEKQQYIDIATMGILGWGLGSFASCIYYLSLWEALKGSILVLLAILLMNSWAEPYEYRSTYLKWLMILLLVPAIGYLVVFFTVPHPTNFKLPYLIIGLFFVAALFSKTLKTKKDLGF
ncbi:MAG: hypothetical protein GX119_04510 [Syntrophomonadaceae bacterium]|jgi:hypothetical protein|nr:hypothetical protein [Syntrophomonadaceae bacterium]